MLVSYLAVAPETWGQTRHQATKGFLPIRLFVRLLCLNIEMLEHESIDRSLIAVMLLSMV